jgi:hypothetical protein
MPDAPNKTFGQRCVDRLYEARVNTALNREAIARIIDEEFAMTRPDFVLNPATGKKQRAGDNIPPTPEEVTAYGKKIGWPIDGAAFVDHYDAIGWRPNGVPMKNWQSKLRMAKRMGYTYGGPRSSFPAKKSDRPASDYTKF